MKKEEIKNAIEKEIAEMDFEKMAYDSVTFDDDRDVCFEHLINIETHLTENIEYDSEDYEIFMEALQECNHIIIDAESKFISEAKNRLHEIAKNSDKVVRSYVVEEKTFYYLEDDFERFKNMKTILEYNNRNRERLQETHINYEYGKFVEDEYGKIWNIHNKYHANKGFLNSSRHDRLDVYTIEEIKADSKYWNIQI